MDKGVQSFYRLGFTLLGIAAFIMVAVVVEPSVSRSSSETMTEVLERATVNGANITVKGQAPFYLKIDNLPQLTSLASLDEYIAGRKPSLARLADQNQSRQIEVSISPQYHMPLAQVWALRDAYKLDMDQMLVDFFLAGKWHSVMFVGDPNDPGERQYIDFTTSADKFQAQIKGLIPPQASDKVALDTSKLELRVSWVRAKAQALDALKLSSNSSIMLVDPITDILDAYQGRAVDVRAPNVPHLLVEKSRLEETRKTVPLSAPGVGQLTPSPVRR